MAIAQSEVPEAARKHLPRYPLVKKRPRRTALIVLGSFSRGDFTHYPCDASARSTALTRNLPILGARSAKLLIYHEIGGNQSEKKWCPGAAT
jgi:hypothetical protein